MKNWPFQCVGPRRSHLRQQMGGASLRQELILSVAGSRPGERAVRDQRNTGLLVPLHKNLGQSIENAALPEGGRDGLFQDRERNSFVDSCPEASWFWTETAMELTPSWRNLLTENRKAAPSSREDSPTFCPLT